MIDKFDWIPDDCAITHATPTGRQTGKFFIILSTLLRGNVLHCAETSPYACDRAVIVGSGVVSLSLLSHCVVSRLDD